MNAPDFIIPYISRFYEPHEIALIDFMGTDSLRMEEITSVFPFFAQNMSSSMETFLERSIRRGVLTLLPGGTYIAADFRARYEIKAVFEGLGDIPHEIKKELGQWELRQYIKDNKKALDLYYEFPGEEAMIKAFKGKTRGWPRYILLHEAFEIIEHVKHIYLWPCNCRSMMESCNNNVYTCLRFDNDRNLGWEISKDKAKAIIKKANTDGLMQTSETAILKNGDLGGAICNCCGDCCFPHQLTISAGAEKIWPYSRYRVAYDDGECTACGKCLKRCWFNVFSFKEAFSESLNETDRKSNNTSKALLLDYDLCRGCGLCAESCPEKALEMIRI